MMRTLRNTLSQGYLSMSEFLWSITPFPGMAFKFLSFVALIATSRAGVVGYSSTPGLSRYQEQGAPVEKVLFQPSLNKALYQQQPANLIYQQQPEATNVVYQPQPQTAKILYQSQPETTKVVYQSQPETTKLVYQQQPESPKLVYQQQPANLIYQQQPAPAKVVYQPQPAKLVYQQRPEAAEEQPEPAHYDTNPQYSYNYDVQDGLTGDNKSQYETREGDVVKGSYSVIEADGSKRTVEYTADPKNGFNAVVRREPPIVKAAVPAEKVAYAPTRPVHSYYNH